MQWKLPPPRRAADRIHRWGMRRGFPALIRIAPRWPRRLLFVNARWVIRVIMGVYPKPKTAVAANLSRILGQPPGSRQVRRAVGRMLSAFAYSWVDLFRFAQLPPEEGHRLVAEVRGLDQVDAALEEGRGAILLTAHLGPWELGGILLRNRGRSVSVVYVPDKYEHAEQFRSSLRRFYGDLEEIPVRLDSPLSTLPVLHALRDNRVVAMQGDRDFSDTGHPVSLFGGTVKLPRGPFVVARATGAPLFPSFVTYTEDYRVSIVSQTPIEVSRGGERDEDVARAIERWARVLEAAVRRSPEQLFTFYDIWAEEAESSP